MLYFILDTNVLVIANGRDHAPQASPECVENCQQKLLEISQSHGFVIDNQRRILREYLDNIPTSNPVQQKPGGAFLKWVLRNWQNPQVCEQVAITPIPEENTPQKDWKDFAEFPRDPHLATFDSSDHKFVAVALTSAHHPPIVIASDRGWVNHATALQNHDVQLQFLCHP